MEVIDMRHYSEFTMFYENEHIQRLGKNKRWTISDVDKMPVDLGELERNWRVRGASIEDPSSMRSLDELCQMMPIARNNAYYLIGDLDKYCVLDIEAECPRAMKAMFLNMPYLYAEVSMSGKGLHLLMPYPEKLFEKYPEAQTKSVIKDRENHYEILIQHWVTFTRRPLMNDRTATIDFERWLEPILSEQKASPKADVNMDEDAPDMTFANEHMMPFLLSEAEKYLEDRGQQIADLSAREFGLMGKLYSSLSLFTRKNPELEIPYTMSDWPWIMYAVAIKCLPHREKHDSCRNGYPWLLYEAVEATAKNSATDMRGMQ